MKKVVNVVVPVEVEVKDEVLEIYKRKLANYLERPITEEEFFEYIANGIVNLNKNKVSPDIQSINGIGILSFNAKKTPVYDYTGLEIKVNTKIK